MTEQPEDPAPLRSGDEPLPGDPSRREQIRRMIRVDQAGEFGAVRIYAGQLAVLGARPGGQATPAAAAIRHMAAQEQEHLQAFDRLMVERRVRPTALSPVWHVAGWALGAASALMGERAAMACTVAVEEVIDEHYTGQLERLGDDEAALRDMIGEFREDEIRHRDTALEHDAAGAPGYGLLRAAVKGGSRLAIWLSTRV